MIDDSYAIIFTTKINRQPSYYFTYRLATLMSTNYPMPLTVFGFRKD